MAGKILIESKNPVTQTPQAVEALAAFVHKPIEGGILNLGAVRLVLSSKGDCFYTVTARDCSCPARCYHPEKPCKHMKAFHGIPREMLVDAYAFNPTDGEVEYWQKKGDLELMNTVGFRPVIEEEV